MKLKDVTSNLFAEIDHIPDVLNQKYLPSLDGFRAIAIVLTIYTHITQTHFGPLGVQVFFVISGFLITTLLLKEKTNKGTIGIKNFYIRRFFRIIPISWLYILIVAIISFITHVKIGLFSYTAVVFFFANIVNDTWFFGHYWSLSVEEQYYIFFPSIVKYTSIRNYVSFLISFLLFIFIARYFNDLLWRFKNIASPRSVLHYIHYILFITNFDGIIIGSLFSVISYKSLFNYKLSNLKKYLITIIIIPSIYVMYVYWESIFTMTIISTLISILIAINLQINDDYIYRFLNNSLVKHIGVLSYSLYIWQQLFTFERPWKNSFPFSNSIWLNLVVLYIVGYISYNYFEKPFFKFKRKFI